MKASNPKVMIEAYRLLVERMDAEDMHYPLHLGVTEAGDGEDGRIKGAIGIGSLLLDGLGDTIRVSLTEDSVYEIPVARAIADKAMSLWTAAESEQREPDRGLTGPINSPAAGNRNLDSTDSIDPFIHAPRDRHAPTLRSLRGRAGATAARHRAAGGRDPARPGRHPTGRPGAAGHAGRGAAGAGG